MSNTKSDTRPSARAADGSRAGSEAAEQEAAQWCRLLERMEPTLAHDLRGPLNALTLHLELLRRVAEDIEPASRAERVQRSVDSLDRELGRLTDRIDGLLRLIGALEGLPPSTTLAALLEECEQEVRTAARHRGTALRFEVAADRPLRQREALRRALLLVLFDALDRAQAGGAVALHCEVDGARAVALVEWSTASGDGQPGRPPDLTVVRELLARCGGEVEPVARQHGSALRLRFPIEIDP